MLKIVKMAENNMDMWSEISRVFALIFIDSKYTELNKVMDVDTDRIIACNWNKSRYENLCNLDIEEVLKSAPPRVMAYQVKDGYIYTILDGNHRVMCARTRGLQRIPVLITEVMDMPTYPVKIVDDFLIAGKHPFKIKDETIVHEIMKLLQF